MLEHRQDPLTGRWVSIAAARGERPDDFADGAAPCPFCEGHEQNTPHEVLAVRPAASGVDAPGWQVRVIANKYPAFLASEWRTRSASFSDSRSASPTTAADDFFRREPAAGLHEVIVESPRHLTRVTELTVDQLAAVLRVYRDRLQSIAADGRWRYVLIFKNSGGAAGASLAHIHSQLIALPQLPAAVEQKLERSRKFFAERGRTLWRELVDRELDDGRRIVSASADFVALCPFASSSPYEMLLLPQRGGPHFAQLADDDAQQLAALLRDLVGRLERTVPDVAYNWMIHTAPLDAEAQEHFQWHIELVPRITRTAGYEWATNNSINPVPPETAAATLRAAASETPIQA